jgi:hypothetical protein|tara:strand:- start:1170 stop:1649 length:480 start_codon:yes stop_codon:yes gene_type:complete
MAVPGSGTLVLKELAQECYYGTYGSGTITPPIYLSDLVNGGNAAGSGMVYPAINTLSPQHPTTTVFSDFYGYDQSYAPVLVYAITLAFNPADPQDACLFGTQSTFYIDSNTTWLNATQLWDNSGATIPSAPGFYAELTGRPRWVREWDGANFTGNDQPC